MNLNFKSKVQRRVQFLATRCHWKPCHWIPLCNCFDFEIWISGSPLSKITFLRFKTVPSDFKTTSSWLKCFSGKTKPLTTSTFGRRISRLGKPRRLSFCLKVLLKSEKLFWRNQSPNRSNVVWSSSTAKLSTFRTLTPSSATQSKV